MAVKVLNALDISQQALALPEWQLNYAQMSEGRFQGSVVRANLCGVQVYEEKINTRVEQSFHAPANSLIFSFDMNDCSLYVLDSESKNTWVTPEHHREIAVIVDLQRLRQTNCATSLEGVLRTPLLSAHNQLFGSWLSHQLRTMSGLPEGVVAPDMSHQLIEDCFYVLENSTRLQDSAVERRWTVGRRIATTVFDYVEAHPGETFNVLELANVVGVSVRHLQQSFKSYTDMSPTEWLRLRRLNSAYRDLLRASPGQTTVTEVATQWSFWHLGRFSTEYYSLFNEYPKQTLHRRPQ